MISSATSRRAFGSLSRASAARYMSSSNTVGPSSRKSALQNPDENTYAKQDDPMGHPTISDDGKTTYVVSDPDPKGTKYDIPGYVLQALSERPNAIADSCHIAVPINPHPSTLSKRLPMHPLQTSALLPQLDLLIRR